MVTAAGIAAIGLILAQRVAVFVLSIMGIAAQVADPADSESRLTLDLSVSGAIATGTWKERTAPPATTAARSTTAPSS
ncbi:hypothetical protein [Kribbella sp. VKM Ac-2571]|uniref:hypothetical protein n=1 Tax=Kribbella sp. VKM Ac-2571 TaxID=2512222 RepID=UPI00105F7ABA|nr:hypothetical protein [Kribbella sp. VKM Ac-2571]